MNNIVYPKPAIGSKVTLARQSWCSYTTADSPIDGIMLPTLSGKAEPFPAGTELEVLKLIPFPKETWKALLKHHDGRLCYMSEWEIHSPELTEDESE